MAMRKGMDVGIRARLSGWVRLRSRDDCKWSGGRSHALLKLRVGLPLVAKGDSGRHDPTHAMRQPNLGYLTC